MMSFFKFDESNASTGFELVAEGKYEVVVVNAVAGETGAKKPKLTVDFEIRSDVPQNHQGAKILYNTFTFEHEVAVRIVSSFIKACGFANNHEFKSAEDMANQVINKSLNITVRHEEYEKNVDGEKQKRTAAKAKYYNPSEVKQVMEAGGFTIGDDDLPF
jgi:Ser-tRNA(Ala) deacylase AlaX